MPSNTFSTANPNTPPDQDDDMAHSGQTHTPSPVMATSKPTAHSSPSPAPSHASASVATPALKNQEHEHANDNYNHHGAPAHSNGGPQQPPSPPTTRRSPTVLAKAHLDTHSQQIDDHRSYYPPAQDHANSWHGRGSSYPDGHEHERYPPASGPYHGEYPGSTAAWSRASSPSVVQSEHRHMYGRHGYPPRNHSPQSYTSRPPPSDMEAQRPYSAPAYHHEMHQAPDSYPTKRHRIESDSEGFSDQEGRYRAGQSNDRHHLPYQERENYHSSYQYDPNSGKGHHYYNEHSREYNSYSNAPSADGLPPLAPRPSRYAQDEEMAAGGPHHPQHQHHHPQPHQQHHGGHSHPHHHSQPKKEPIAGLEPVKIQSARGTPKGPLPIDVQINLLSSVLRHDPFNCAIRKTTQAWEMISREQGIRARTCSRRFDNIIQASIAGRDRPVGTEDQQAAKKKLLEQLFEMMNQPQALKRMQKKRRYRSEDTDRRLLQETIRLNPFAQKVGQVAKAWEDVRDALDMKVHARQCIRRVNRMVKPYLLRERMYRGNIPDEMKEANDDLVKQVINLMRMAGQGGAIDDEDSASGMSDSDEQDDPFMDSKGQGQAQEDDELEEDEDDEMASPTDIERRRTVRKDESVPPGIITPSSPSAPALPSPSTQSNTPSIVTSAPSGPSSGAATPAKRGRPRNPVSSAYPTRQSGQGAPDRARNQSSALGTDNGEGGESKDQRTDPNGVSEDCASGETGYARHDSVMQSTTLSPPLPVQPSYASGHARQYSHGEYMDSSDYRRPIKHARTSSRDLHDITIDATHPENRASAVSPGGRHRDDPNYRYSGSHSHGRPTTQDMSTPDTSASAPTSQQYRDVVNELQIMRDYLAQMDDHRRREMARQNSMMNMIEKLQSQMQHQQHQLAQLQHQLRYGGYGSQQQGNSPQPPLSPHHPHHQQQPSHSSQGSHGVPSGPSPTSVPPSVSGRFTPHHHPVEARAATDHVSFTRSEHHFQGTRDSR